MIGDTWTHTVTAGPWPERIGRRCRIVPRPDGPAGRVYPFHGRSPGEVIILIEDDPLTSSRHHPELSCALNRTDITEGTL